MFYSIKKCVGFIIIACICHAILLSSISSANDMPMAGIAANGIVVKDEKNIQIVREDLYISNLSIEVSYEFRNASATDISTEVAFPIPRHQYDPSGHIKNPVHGDFKVLVNNKEVKCSLQARALFKDKDYSSLLSSMNVSIVDFGNNNQFFPLLSKTNQKTLLDLGLVTDDPAEGVMPQWSVEATYYWKQTFPANSTVNIKHSYKPNVYFATLYVEAPRSADAISKIESLAKDFCLDQEFKAWLESSDNSFQLERVNYILTTANHWKKPIKEFHIILDSSKNFRPMVVSTCFENGKLQKVSSSRYEAVFKDYVPANEIEVNFLRKPY